MKLNLITLLFSIVLIASCNSQKTISIDKKELLENIKILSHDSLEGRGFSKPGNYKAQQFIAKKFAEIGLETVNSSNFIEKFPYTFSGVRKKRMFPKDSTDKDTTVYGGNVIGKISGKTNKIIVVSGHLDHLGIRDGKIYNGADDDASGTAALFSIASYFKENKLNHTIIIAAVDAEEIGSLGASYWLKNFSDKKFLRVRNDLHRKAEIEAFFCFNFLIGN